MIDDFMSNIINAELVCAIFLIAVYLLGKCILMPIEIYLKKKRYAAINLNRSLRKRFELS